MGFNIPRNQKLTDNNDEENFHELFAGNIIYEIPLFQRDYKWDHKLLKPLINDFNEIYDGIKNVHFFGAIIVHETRGGKLTSYRNIEVIDGQQRLTTMFLFVLATIYLIRTIDKEAAKEQYDTYLVNKNKPTMIPNINDRAQLNWIFKNILTDPFNELLENSKKYETLPTDSSSKEEGILKTNYSRFKFYLQEKFGITKDKFDPKDTVFKLENMLARILTACKVVTIKIDQRHYGPQIFDKLNAKPVRMTISELVKNAIFARMAEEEIDKIVQVHKAYWIPFEQKFINGKKGLENYFFPYSLIHDPSTTKTDAYQSITERWSSESLDTQKIISELTEYQEGFNALTSGIANHYPRELQTSIYRIYGAKLPDTALPFFMCLLKKVECDPNYLNETIKIFSTLETYFVRRQVCGVEPTGLHAVFKNLWGTLNSNGEVTAVKVFNFIKNLQTQACPDDDQFRESLLSAPIGKKVIKRFLLEEYDISLNAETIEWNKKTEVEHILPRNISNWRDFPDYSEEEHASHVELFGNLVPLSDKLNNDVSNKSFLIKKKKIDTNSMYKSTREVFEKYDSWKPSDIQERTLNLTNWALSRWIY